MSRHRESQLWQVLKQKFASLTSILKSKQSMTCNLKNFLHKLMNLLAPMNKTNKHRANISPMSSKINNRSSHHSHHNQENCHRQKLSSSNQHIIWPCPLRTGASVRAGSPVSTIWNLNTRNNLLLPIMNLARRHKKQVGRLPQIYLSASYQIGISKQFGPLNEGHRDWRRYQTSTWIGLIPSKTLIASCSQYVPQLKFSKMIF